MECKIKKMDQTLKSIELNNFLNHPHFKVDLQPGINSITGDNDKGKSAILTAISWVYDGKPSGDTVEPWTGEKHTFVKLSFVDGLIITRHRKKGKNWYEINDRKLESIGNSVPDEITKALNLSDINFQGQANNLWPMQLTDGQFSKLINKYSNLEEAHIKLKQLISEEKKQREQLELNKTTLKSALEKIESLKWVYEAQGMVDSAHVIQRTIDDFDRKHTETQAILKTIQETALRHSENKKVVDVFSKKMKSARGTCDEIQKIETKSEQIKDICSQIKQINARLRGKAKIQRASKELKQARLLISEYSELTNGIENTESKLKSIKSVNSRIKLYNKDMETIKKQIAEIRKNLPEVCPLCKMTIIREGDL